MTTTTLNKTARTVVASQSAAVGTPVRGTLDLRTVQGGILFAKITNGSSGPTEPCALIISAAVSDGATPASGAVGATWKRVMTFAGTTAANDVTDWALDIPPVQHLQVEFSGNTGQAVTVEAFFSEITSAFEAQISALFASGEQGAWYDPSDLSTLYQDSAGTTSVTALGQPVGLMLDKRFGLVRGPELWPQTAFNAADGLTLDANWTIAGGVATSDGGSGFIKVTVNPLTGKWYEATMDVASYASGPVFLPYDGVGTNIVTVTSAGSYRRVFLDKSTELRVYSKSFAGSIDNISVRELPGNHASQPTATARPTLQADASGRKYLQFDGVDDLLATTFPDLGANVTIGRSIPGTGAQILTGQTINGNWDDSTDSHALVVIDRALTAPETASLTRWLNQRAGV